MHNRGIGSKTILQKIVRVIHIRKRLIITVAATLAVVLATLFLSVRGRAHFRFGDFCSPLPHSTSQRTGAGNSCPALAPASMPLRFG